MILQQRRAQHVVLKLLLLLDTLLLGREFGALFMLCSTKACFSTLLYICEVSFEHTYTQMLSFGLAK